MGPPETTIGKFSHQAYKIMYLERKLHLNHTQMTNLKNQFLRTTKHEIVKTTAKEI